MSDPIYDNLDPERYLYHYTAIRTYRKILHRMRLKISPYAKSNDPYETKERFLTVFSKNNSPRNVFSRLASAKKNLNTELSKYGLISFATDKQPLVVDQLSNRGCSLLSMWAHYAKNHKGVCIVLDRQTLLADLSTKYSEQAHCDYVNYVDMFTTDAHRYRQDASNVYIQEELSSETAISTTIERSLSSNFLLKDKSWAGEQEFRCVLPYIKDNEFIDIRNSLVGLIVGARVKADAARKLERISQEKYPRLFVRHLQFSDYFYLSEILPSRKELKSTNSQA